MIDSVAAAHLGVVRSNVDPGDPPQLDGLYESHLGYISAQVIEDYIFIGEAMTDRLFVRKSLPFVNINIITTNSLGVGVTPDTNPTARIYRVDPAGGALALDYSLGDMGVITLSQLDGQQGWHGVGLDLTASTFEQYEILVSYSITAVVFHQKVSLQVSSELEAINDAATSNVTVASIGTTFKAPSPSGS